MHARDSWNEPKTTCSSTEAVKKAVEIQSKFEVELQGASHTSSMRVDPPDEVVALRKRIAELEEEAQSRVRAPQEDELPATVHASTAAEINQLRVIVQNLQRERDFLRSEMAKNRCDQSLLMSTLIDQGDSLRRGVGSNRCNPLGVPTNHNRGGPGCDASPTRTALNP